MQGMRKECIAERLDIIRTVFFSFGTGFTFFPADGSAAYV